MKNKKIVIPVTESQKRLWAIQNLDEVSVQYNSCFSLTLSGSVSIERIRKVFEGIVNRHCAFKTAFLSINEAILFEEVSLDFRYEDLRDSPSLSEDDLIAELKKRCEIPFDLKQAPLARVHLLQLQNETFLLLFVAHHIVTDAASFGVIVAEMKSDYADLKIITEDDRESYLNYQNENQFENKKSLSFWTKQMESAAILDFPTDYPRNTQEAHMIEYLFDIEPRYISQIHDAAKSFQTSSFKYLLACYVILLHRYTLQDHFIVGVPTHGRQNPELQNKAGFFVKLLPVHFHIDSNMSFSGLLQHVTAQLNAAVAHQDVPYMDLLNLLELSRDAVHDPLFNNHFNIGMFDTFCNIEFSGIKAHYFWSSSGFAHCDFGMLINKLNERYQLSFKYDGNLFDHSTIQRLALHWLNIISETLSNPDQLVTQIQFLNTQEYASRRQFKSAVNPDQDIEKNILEVFDRHQRTFPHRLAVICEEDSLTYAELYQKTNQLAAYLSETYQISKNDKVAVLFGHEMNLLVSLLAIIRCGATYVSIDSNYPPNRIQHILEDCQARLVITTDQWIHSLKKCEGNYFDDTTFMGAPCLLLDKVTFPEHHAVPADPNLQPDDLVYIVYTSGTTGKPKGVKTTHQGLLNLARFEQKALGLNGADCRILQFAATGFDAFAWEWSSSVYSGATLIFSRHIGVGDELSEVINHFNITHITLPPSILKTLHAEENTCLKTVVVAGEACTPEIINDWHKQVNLINAYGPSENTVCSTLFNCTPDYPAATIGKPIDDVDVFILDKYTNQVPIGVVGEIHLGGANLSPGYLNQPGLTAEKFISITQNHQQIRVYKSGDLGKYLPDGNIVFSGRKDFQIKLRGFRIELGDILVQFSRMTGIEQAEVLFIDDNQKSPYLAAFIVFSDKAVLSTEVSPRIDLIKEQLKKQLPGYMVPERIMAISAMPLTDNKKINREKLLDELRNYQCDTSNTVQMTETEEVLLQLWKAVLHREDISLDANFFDIGGHSLSASNLAEKIKKEFNIKFRPIDLYHYPSIKQLAKTLHSNKTHNPLLVPLAVNAHETDIFCLHPIGGNVLCYLPLAKKLSNYANVWGISADHSMHKKEELSIYTMATDYFNAIKSKQKDGPYHLVGYCMGGIIAYELAKIFQANGDEIAQLTIVDSYMPEEIQRVGLLSSERDFIILFLRMALVTAKKIDIMEQSIAQINASANPLAILVTLLEINQIYHGHCSIEEISLMLEALKANYHALINYTFSSPETLMNGLFVYSEKTIAEVEGYEDSLFKKPIFNNMHEMLVAPCNHEQIMLEDYLDYWVDDCFKELKNK